MTDLFGQVDGYGSTHILVDYRKPYVGRTQFTRTWYWKCDRCTRHVIMSGQPHHMVLYDALLHASSLNHHHNRYTKKGAFNDE